MTGADRPADAQWRWWREHRPHLDCTPGDLDRLRQALLTLG